ncbi:hypothetical protein FRC03_009555 [Tulasnella sp. 419]|nr:hypothetical protein FRC03_009555 [Tulasnella sp. 419]
MAFSTEPSFVALSRAITSSSTSLDSSSSRLDRWLNETNYDAVDELMQKLTDFINRNDWLKKEQEALVKIYRARYFSMQKRFKSLSFLGQVKNAYSHTRDVQEIINKLKLIFKEFEKFRTDHVIEQRNALAERQRALRDLALGINQVSESLDAQATGSVQADFWGAISISEVATEPQHHSKIASLDLGGGAGPSDVSFSGPLVSDSDSSTCSRSAKPAIQTTDSNMVYPRDNDADSIDSFYTPVNTHRRAVSHS